MIIRLALTVAALCCASSLAQEMCDDPRALADWLFDNYEKRRPSEHTLPVDLEVWLQAASLVGDSSIEFDMYLSQQWHEPQLNYRRTCPYVHNITVDWAHKEKMWDPEIGVINARSLDLHESPPKNVFFFLYQNGTVWLNYRFRIVANCAHEAMRYPLDTLRCDFIWESYRYSEDEVAVEMSNAIALKHPFAAGPFEMVSSTTRQASPQYPAGRWSEVTHTVEFQRVRMGGHWVVTVIPSIVAVLAAWFSLLSGSPAIASSRTILVIGGLIVLIIQLTTVQVMAPSSNGPKYIDCWILGCIVFVFAFAVELAIGLRCCGDQGDYSQLNSNNSPTKQRICTVTGNLTAFILLLLFIAYCALWAIYTFGWA